MQIILKKNKKNNKLFQEFLCKMAARATLTKAEIKETVDEAIEREKK